MGTQRYNQNLRKKQFVRSLSGATQFRNLRPVWEGQLTTYTSGSRQRCRRRTKDKERDPTVALPDEATGRGLRSVKKQHGTLLGCPSKVPVHDRASARIFALLTSCVLGVARAGFIKNPAIIPAPIATTMRMTGCAASGCRAATKMRSRAGVYMGSSNEPSSRLTLSSPGSVDDFIAMSY